MNAIDKVVSKISSGKWVLTVISGVVFAYATFKGILSAEAVASIVSMVFVSYFNKKDDYDGNTTAGGNGS